jgi:hypothetical protein
VNVLDHQPVPPAAPAVEAHRHQWEHRPHQSGYLVTRYFCAGCSRWARRQWPTRRGAVAPPIVPYPPRLKTPPVHWGVDDTNWVYITPKPPRVRDDPENPSVWTPPLRWKNHL